MIAEFGESALISTLVISALCGFIALLPTSVASAAFGPPQRCALLRNAFAVFGIFITTGLLLVATLILIYGFITSDFSLKGVFENSHTDDALVYRFTAMWSYHEGSALLWVLVASGLMSLALATFRAWDKPWLNRACATFHAVQAAMVWFMVQTSNPFATLAQGVRQGLGMNPLLQDPSMTFHPPALYLGFVGYVVLYCASFSRRIPATDYAAYLSWLHRWSTIAWVFLTLGIMTGSFWAYYELGWGGWWAWDPVENASVLPWLMGMIHLHRLAQVMRYEPAQQDSMPTNRDRPGRKALPVGIFLPGTLCFILSLLGTFITRSGIVASVHGFARDLDRGIWLAVMILGALSMLGIQALYLRRSRCVDIANKPYALAITWNTWTMAALLILLLLMTFMPVLLPLMGGAAHTPSTSAFNAVLVPVLGVMLLLMLVDTVRRQRMSAGAEREAGKGAWSLRQAYASPLWLPTINVGLMTLVLLLYGAPSSDFYLYLVVPVAVMLIALSVYRVIVSRRRWPRAMLPKHLAHLGVAVIALGATINGTVSRSNSLLLPAGKNFVFAGFSFSLLEVSETENPTYTVERARLRVTPTGGRAGPTFLAPERRVYKARQVMTIKSALKRDGLSFIYVVLGPETKSGDRYLIFSYHRWVLLIWFGGALLVLSGLLLIGRRKFSRRKEF